MFAKGSLLGQVAPVDLNAISGFTATLDTEVTRIAVCNTTGTAATFRLFHDVGGTAYAVGNALYYDKSVPANDTVWITSDSIGSGIHLLATDSLGVRTGTADALTFSIYGVTADLAPTGDSNG